MTGSESRGAQRRARHRRFTARQSGLAYGLLLPSFIGFAVFAYWPLYRLIHFATHQQSSRAGGGERSVGFGAVIDVVTGDSFRSGTWITLKYLAYTVPLGLLLGVLLALAANKPLRGIRFFQTVFSSTVASSVAVSSVVFFSLVNDQIGLLRNVSWLSLRGTNSALFAAAVSSVWQNLGLTFVIVLAALQTVPEELTEAALLDGYGPVRRFLRVTVPLISPALMFLAVVLVIHAFQAYAQIELITQGGPLRSTETLLYRITQLQKSSDLQIGASMSLGLFALTFLVAAAQFALLERRVQYGN